MSLESGAPDSLDDRINWLRKEISHHIAGFDRGRKENKRKALRFRLSIVALGGLTTVFLGLKDTGFDSVLRNAALIASALVTLLSTWDAFYNHRGLWVRYTATLVDLYAIDTELRYLCEQGVGMIRITELDALFVRMQKVLKDTNEWWQQERGLFSERALPEQ
jgi:hypothetical protein